jgi:hypothetical protein
MGLYQRVIDQSKADIFIKLGIIGKDLIDQYQGK